MSQLLDCNIPIYAAQLEHAFLDEWWNEVTGEEVGVRGP